MSDVINEKIQEWRRKCALKKSLEAKIQITPSCWWFLAGPSNRYGQIKFAGKQMLAHRVSFEVYNGDIPAGLVVRHRCDNPRCVNPDHLILGTYAENSQDMIDRGRAYHGGPGTPAKGIANGNAKLSFKAVQKLRELWATGEFKREELGYFFQINQSHVWRLVNGVHRLEA